MAHYCTRSVSDFVFGQEGIGTGLELDVESKLFKTPGHPPWQHSPALFEQRIFCRTRYGFLALLNSSSQNAEDDCVVAAQHHCGTLGTRCSFSL